MPHVSISAASRGPEPARVRPHRFLDAAAVLAERVALRELEEQRLGLGARGTAHGRSSIVAAAPASGWVIARKNDCEMSA